jgi:hypothetical protein
MADQNTTHSPRVDDQLAHDSEALTHGAPDDGRQEWRRDQVAGDDEPEAVVDRDASEAELDERSRLAASLLPSAFPATGTVLADVAEAAHAHPDHVAGLRSLPEGRIYETFAEVWSDLGGDVERRG